MSGPKRTAKKKATSRVHLALPLTADGPLLRTSDRHAERIDRFGAEVRRETFGTKHGETKVVRREKYNGETGEWERQRGVSRSPARDEENLAVIAHTTRGDGGLQGDPDLGSADDQDGTEVGKLLAKRAQAAGQRDVNAGGHQAQMLSCESARVKRGDPTTAVESLMKGLNGGEGPRWTVFGSTTTLVTNGDGTEMAGDKVTATEHNTSLKTLAKRNSGYSVEGGGRARAPLLNLTRQVKLMHRQTPARMEEASTGKKRRR